MTALVPWLSPGGGGVGVMHMHMHVDHGLLGGHVVHWYTCTVSTDSHDRLDMHACMHERACMHACYMHSDQFGTACLGFHVVAGDELSPATSVRAYS